MATEHGFIYVLANDSMPGIYKIGYTNGHPKMLMDQLSGATACPTPFELLAYFGTENPRTVEKEMHLALDAYRINSSREFFKCPLELIHNLVHCNSDQYGDLANTFLLNAECQHEIFRNAQAWKRDYFFEQSADSISWPSGFGLGDSE